MHSVVEYDELDSLVIALEAVLIHLKKRNNSEQKRNISRNTPQISRDEIVMAAPLMRDSEIDLIYFLSTYGGETATDSDICDALGISAGSLKVYACRSRSTLHSFGITPSIIRRRQVGYRISKHAIAGLLYRSKADLS